MSKVLLHVSILAGAIAFAGCSSDGGAADSGTNPADTGGNNPADTGTDNGDTGEPPPPDAGFDDNGNPIDTGVEEPDSGVEIPPNALPEGAAAARRGDMVFAADPRNGRVYMFSGDRAEPMNCGPAASDFIDDLFFFDTASNRWVPIEIDMNNPRPTRRARGVGTWDAMRNRLILFGGRFRQGTSGAYTFLKDVWAYEPDTNTWTELSPQNNPQGPSGRMNSAIVADPDNDRVLIVGGGTTDQLSFRVDAQVWAFNFADNTWQRLGMGMTQPPGMIFHNAAYDQMRRRLYVFGGGGEDAFTSPTFFRDVWWLDLDSDTWTQMAAPADPMGQIWPFGRIKATMEYDKMRDQLVLFAGHDDQQLGNDNEVWTFDLAAQSWSLKIRGDTFNRRFPDEPFCDFPADFANIDPMSPERRESHLFVIYGDEAIMYGGRTDCGLCNDTWILDLPSMTWTQITESFNGMTCFRSGRTDCNTKQARKCG